MKKSYFKQLLILVILFFTPKIVQASDAVSSSTFFWSVIIILIILVAALLAVMSMLFTLKNILGQDAKNQAIAAGTEIPESNSIWKNISKSLWNRASVEEEKDLVLDHDFDGIRELDNHLPPWWLYTFYGTIIWGVAYVLIYHVFESAPLQTEEYNNEIAAAEASLIAFKEKNPEKKVDLQNIIFSNDEAQITQGGKIFAGQCAICHRTDAGGLVGPNLTDKYWKHGGSAQNIFTVITNGVPNTGMIAWKSTFSPSQISDIIAYIHSLQGSNPENPKKPEGEIYVAAATVSGGAVISNDDSTSTDTQSATAIIDVEAASKLFTACAVCHRADGGGQIGPNLTDEFWKHGGSKEDIINTITNGVSGTAMISYKSSYSDTEIGMLADYIQSLQGSNPENPKEAEGEKYEAN